MGIQDYDCPQENVLIDTHEGYVLNGRKKTRKRKIAQFINLLLIGLGRPQADIFCKVIPHPGPIPNCLAVDHWSWCTDCNAKTRTNFDWPFLKKWDLTVEKIQKKLNYFWSFSCFFSETDNVYRLFECFYEVSWSTDFNSTETSHVLCTILEKIWKNCKKGSIFLDFFGQSSWIFSKNSLSKWVLVFCFAISSSRRFF